MLLVVELVFFSYDGSSFRWMRYSWTESIPVKIIFYMTRMKTDPVSKYHNHKNEKKINLQI